MMMPSLTGRCALLRMACSRHWTAAARACAGVRTSSWCDLRFTWTRSGRPSGPRLSIE